MKVIKKQQLLNMRDKRVIWGIALTVCLLLLPVSCGGVNIGGTGVFDTVGKVVKAVGLVKKFVKSFQELSPEEEYYLGRSVAATIAGQYKAYPDQQANLYLNELGQTLAQFSDRPQTYGGYHFQILDADEINAFAAPGGFIFVTRGLLRCAQREDAVAAVLAHEIGHVELKHGLAAINKSRRNQAYVEVGLEVAQDKMNEQAARLVGLLEDSIKDITVTMMNNGYSRSLEREADEASVTILKRAGYDPNGLIDVLKVMATKLDPKGKDFAKTHPTPADRIKDIQKLTGSTADVKSPDKRQARFQAALGKI